MHHKPQRQAGIPYKGGHIRQTPQGWIADLRIDGKRLRHRATSQKKCEEWISERTAAQHLGVAPLSPAEILMYREACKNLPPGTSLLDAVGALQRQAAPLLSVTVEEARRQFLEDRAASGLRPRSLQNLRYTLAKLPAGPLPNTGRLAGLLPRNPTTRNNLRRAWHTFFAWCVGRGYLHANPAAALSMARLDERIPEVLTVLQARSLLEAAWRDDRAYVPYFALQLFAGLRQSEVMALRWSDIGEAVTVGSRIAKSRRTRYVTISDNLREWLAVDHDPDARVVPVQAKALQVHVSKIRTAAGLLRWPHNAMRHSFASYHLAAGRDWPRTAFELGHGSNTDVLARHYRQLVTPEAAEEYWKIRPPCASSVPKKAFKGLVGVGDGWSTVPAETA